MIATTTLSTRRWAKFLTAFALACLCGCGSVRVDEATSTYTRIGWVSGTIAFGFGGLAAFGLLAVLVTLFQLVFSQSARDSFSEDDKKAVSIVLPALTGALLFCGLVYYDAVSNVVTLSPDGFTVSHLTRADEVVRFDELCKLEIVYMQSNYTGGGGADQLRAVPKPPAGSKWTESDFVLHSKNLVLGPALESALPDIFRKAKERGVSCNEKP